MVDIVSINCHLCMDITYNRPMADWFNKDRYFLPNKFRSWMQSVVKKTFNITSFSAPGQQVTFKTSGPAITLQIVGTRSYDVDLVPVIQMKDPLRPPHPVRAFPKDCKSKTSWYLVPKPIKTNGNNNNGDQLHWRLALHEQERELINGKQHLKPALRLLKKFRDTQNFTKIASYYLKTVCMWEIDKKENESMWSSAPVGYVFIHLLRAFKACLEAKNIPYYWQKENNLLTAVNAVTVEDNCNRLKRILQEIEINPKKVPEFLLPNQELTTFRMQRL